ncbi:MAG: gliding motility-associated C-terminal domain-containing protein, partial [Cytophagales bacterium]|nr:gliding motility-associated C-terminal domain-containing protein [Cytophagales bacterium]
LGETQINAINQGNIEFTGNGLETGATLNYSFTSSGGGIAVTGSEAVTLASQVFDNGGTGYDLSGLADGTITLTISLTDAPGNTGVAATTTETKDAAPPTGYTVAWDDALINSSGATATTFTVTNTEIGATINYTVSSAGDGNTATISNAILVTAEPQEVTVDVSSLPDGILTVQVTLTDPGNNTGSAASDNSATLDQQVPSGYTVTIDQADINTINQTAASFTFAGAEVGASYNFTLTSTGGPGTVTGMGNITVGNQQVTGIDVSPLPDGTLTLSVTLSDPAGNIGMAATDNVAKTTTTVQFATTNSNGNEAVASASLGVNLSSSSAQVITVSYTVSGTATAGGTDHDLADGILTITPGNASGTIEISNIVDDNVLEANETVIVTLSSPVNAVLGANTLFTYTILDNDAASVTIADASGDENDGAITVTATLDNAVQGGFTLEVSTSDGTAGGSDYTPVTNQLLTFTGSAMEAQTFTVTPVADSEVESDETVTLAMSNLGATTLSVDISNIATLTINNDDNAPVIDLDQVLTVVESAPNTTLVGTISAQEADGDALQDWTITAGNTSLDGDAIEPFNLDPVSGMLTVNDSDDLASSLSVFLLEVTVSDGVNISRVETVTINVEGVNDAPVFTPGSNQQVLEDAGLQTVSDWATGIGAGPADESDQGLTFNVTVDEPALFSQQPAINAEGTLIYSPAPDANGTATITIFLQDDGGTANGGVDRSSNQSFDITIMPVNDAPSFTGGADQNVTAGATATDYTVNNWATNIRSGPPDEAGQVLVFDLESSNTGLFNTPPTIDTNGNLSYAIAPDVVGSSTINVTLIDDGGTTDGGRNVSTVVTFTISVGRLPQVITFGPLEDRRVGADPITLEATGGNSGQPVVFSLVTSPMTGVASLNGNLLTIDGPGTATVTASQLGNEQYEPAQDVSQTFEVIDSELFLPSLFSPNDDQVNDRFVLRGGGNIATIALSIFDRDGNEVYTSQSLTELTQQGWDGTYEGESQPQGAYIWVIQGSLTDGAPLTVMGEKSGVIRLAR